MKRSIVGWLVVPVLCCLCAAQTPAQPAPPAPVEPAKTAPDAAGQAKPEFPPAVKKNLYADHDLRGTSEACQAKYKDDLVVIGISDEKEAKVRDHFKDGGMKYALAVDENAKMKKSIGVKGIPHVLVIGTDNIVRWQGFPGSDEDELTEVKLKQIIDADKARALADTIKKAPKDAAPKGTRKPKGKGG
jgi:hypothetical protein